VSDLLAARVPPGRHHVVFEYAPPSFMVGAVVSGLTFVFLVVMMIREWRQSTGAAHQELAPAVPG